MPPRFVSEFQRRKVQRDTLHRMLGTVAELLMALDEAANDHEPTADEREARELADVRKQRIEASIAEAGG